MLLIKGGRVIDPGGRRDEPGSIVIDGGKVADFLPAGSEPGTFDGTVIDAAGKWVLPGLVDMHVHLREPGFEWKEDIGSGTRAAAAGGFSSVACMANTNPVNDRREVTQFIRERAAAASANVFPVAAVTKGLEGKEMVDFAELAACGAIAFSDDGKPVASALLMRRALEYCKAENLLILSHAEEHELVDGGAGHEGWTAHRLGIPGIPSAAEELGIAREILLARLTGGRVHLQHISTQLGVDMLRMAKRAGLHVTGETAPHYFTLTDAALESYDTNAKMNPPLRGEEDRAAVLAGLEDGTIDAIATDHAPHDDYVKRCEFIAAANGIIGLETALPLSLALLGGGKMSPARLVELLSANPARILGLRGKGTLARGADADVTIVDPALDWVLLPEDLRSKSRNSPFLGWTMRGRAVAVFCGGRITHALDAAVGVVA